MPNGAPLWNTYRTGSAFCRDHFAPSPDASSLSTPPDRLVRPFPPSRADRGSVPFCAVNRGLCHEGSESMPTTGDDRGSGVVGPEAIERYEV